MDNDKLLGLYPGYTSVLGPYKRPDGRQHVVLNNSNVPKGTKGKTRTISYPKALKEIELSARLADDETVDHHDRDFTNDNQANLLVKPRAQHASEDAVRVVVSEINCAFCNASFMPSREQYSNRASGKPGPFCTKSCASSFNAEVRRGERVVEDRAIISKEYRLPQK